MYSEHEIIVFSSDGAIRRITHLGKVWLRTFCRATEDGLIPEMIERWLRQGAQRSLVIRGEDGLLEVEFLPCRHNGEENILILRVAFDSCCGATSEANLSLEEKEVLYWIVKGRSNPEICLLLGKDNGAVEDQVDQIYRKLGVENRAEAICHVLEYS
jgi:DNA-binding NarL/FixJ family response regulator